jgi:hypothetical protein
MQEVDVEQVCFRHPANIFVAGPTGSGKSQLVRSLLSSIEEQLVNVEAFPLRCCWVYGIETDDTHRDINTPFIKVQYTDKVPDIAPYDVVVIDDLQDDAEQMQNLFTQGGHHKKVTIIFICQNFFHPGLRTPTLQAHYVILTKNRRDKQQVAKIGSQMFPGESAYFMDCYKKSMSLKTFGYLLIDLAPATPDWLQLRTSFLPEDYPITVFGK